MSGVSSPQPPARPLATTLGLAIVAITGMQLMSTLDGTIVIVALPRMQAELGLSDAAKSWVITAYVLTFGGPGDSTEILALHIYKTAFVGQQLGVAAAMSVLLLAVVAALSWGALRLSNPMKDDA